MREDGPAWTAAERTDQLLAATRAIAAERSAHGATRVLVTAARRLLRADAAAVVLRPEPPGPARLVHDGLDGPGLADLAALLGLGADPGWEPDPPVADAAAAPSAETRPGGTRTRLLTASLQVKGADHGELHVLRRSSVHDLEPVDRQTVRALVSTTAVTLDNLALLAATRVRERWLEGTLAVNRALLEQRSGAPALQAVTDTVMPLLDARGAAVVVPAPGRPDLLEFVAETRADGGSVVGVRVPRSAAAGVAAAIDQQQGLILDDVPAAMAGMPADAEVIAATTDALVVPLGGPVGGALAVVRGSGAPFTTTELGWVEDYGVQAGLALELVDRQAQDALIALIEQRMRIATDLQRDVVEHVLTLTQTLQGALPRLAAGRPRTAVADTVESLQGTAQLVRNSVFARPLDDGAPGSLTDQVLGLTDAASTLLGHEPDHHFTGDLDALDDPGLGDDVVAVLRESLTNTAKHAHATRTQVRVDLSGGRLTVTVTDDGTGPGTSTRRSGVANLAARAHARGGSYTRAAHPGGGTVVTWTVPVPVAGPGASWPPAPGSA